MEAIAAALLITALAGAALARWTRLHPLLVGALVAIPIAVLATAVAAATMSPAALGAGLVTWTVAAAIGGIGAFLGWLRRKHIERMT